MIRVLAYFLKHSYRKARIMPTEDRIKELVASIKACNEGYWERSSPIVSDPEYDTMVEELRKLDPENPLLNEIGDEHIDGPKIRHDEPTLSLAKTYEWSKLVDWCKSVARSENELFSFSPKFDGISISVEQGKLVTRGGGAEGTDISHLAPWILCRLSWDRTCTESSMHVYLESDLSKVRRVGELLIPIDRFAKMRYSYPELAKYKTPRNMASGFANTKLGAPILEALQYAGLPVPVCTWVWHRAHEIQYSLKSIVSNPDLHEVLLKKLRNYKKCPTDGIVCRLTDDAYAKSLGSTQHHERGAMALKFTDEEHRTHVLGIEWNVANDAVTPVLLLDPVIIDGVEVRRATAHNCKFITDNHITPGALVTIVRRGGVIPKVVKVVPAVAKEGEPFFFNPDIAKYKIAMPELPKVCPSCGEQLTYEEPDLVCKNKNCVGRIVSKIIHGLEFLGIKGLGPAIVERLVRELMLDDIISFCMVVPDEQLLKAKGFTAREIHLIISEIERVMQSGISDADLFASLCIPQASASFADKCIAAGVDLGELDFSNKEMTEKIRTVKGINSTAIANTEKFMSERSGDYLMYWHMFNHERPVDAESRTWYCFTGALPYPRKELEQWVLDAGGYPTDNIRRADYLVSATPTSMSTKMKYARSHNIPVISFEQLMTQLAK